MLIILCDKFQKLYFFKCVNVGYQNLNVFPHPAYILCSVSCQTPRRLLFVMVYFYDDNNNN